jgi:hypothetical protein
MIASTIHQLRDPKLWVVVLALVLSGACAHATRSRPNAAGTLTVTFLLASGQQHVLGPVELRPARRRLLHGRELPYEGGSAMTAVWLKPTAGITQLFVLKEGPGGPGTAVWLNPIRVGPPSEGINWHPVTNDAGPAQLPCVAVSAFFVDGIGAPPPGPVVMWLKQGQQETAFSIRPGTSIRMPSILSVDTARDQILARRDGEYSMEIEKSPEARDVLILAIATKPDGSLTTQLLPSASRRVFIGPLPGPGENSTWRFYALDDRRELHSHCRSIDPTVVVRDTAHSELSFIVTQQYPGFRVLYPFEFDTTAQREFKDGTGGPLIAGNFNYDRYRDFAAIIIVARDPLPYPARRDSNDSYEGKELVCFGTAMRNTFNCQAEAVTVTLPRRNFLRRIPPGRHQCMTGSRRRRTVTTTIDSVGVVSGEAAAAFLVRNRDGSTYRCAPSD